MLGEKSIYYVLDLPESLDRACTSIVDCALPGFMAHDKQKAEYNIMLTRKLRANYRTGYWEFFYPYEISWGCSGGYEGAFVR